MNTKRYIERILTSTRWLAAAVVRPRMDRWRAALAAAHRMRVCLACAVVASGQLLAQTGDVELPQLELAYLETGLHQAWATPGISLLHGPQDNDTAGGSLIHAADAGGGLEANCWSGIVNIPFPFVFWGEPFTQFCVSKHGLMTFSTQLAGQPISREAQSIDVNWPLPNRYYPENTLACFHGRFQRLDRGDDVYAFLHGIAPHRQVWVIFHGHDKFPQGSTHTAVVLEESSNHIYMVDMWTEKDLSSTGKGALTVGIQKDMDHFQEVPASPLIPVINTSPYRDDNDFYLFKPYRVGALTSGPAAPGLAEQADEAVARKMRNLNIPGMTVAASKNGRLVFNRAYGYADVEQEIQMRPWHRTGIGSCSKVITATGVMKLHELGLLPDLDVRAYRSSNLLGTPQVAAGILEGLSAGVHTDDDVEDILDITPRHLLSHTSGFDRSSDGYQAAMVYNDGDYATSDYGDSMRWFLATKSLLSRPGAETHYSNHGYGHLGQLIEILSEADYEDFIQEIVLHPLGITEMRVGQTWLSEQDNIDAKRYHFYDEGMPHPPSYFTDIPGPVTYGYSKPNGPVGSWTATAADLARLMCGTDQLPNHSDILKPGTLKMMETVPYPNSGGDDDPRTQGSWDKDQDGTLHHNGLTGVARGWMCKYPNGINVALCANTGNGGLGKSLADSIMKIVRDTAIAMDYDLFPPAASDVYVDGESGCPLPNGEQLCAPLGGPFPEVNQAALTARAGARIFVRAGSYDESVTFRRAGVVRAYDGTAVIGQ